MKNISIQEILALTIVAAAVYLAAKSIWKALRCKKSVFTSCQNCPLFQNCDKEIARRKAKQAKK